MNSSLPPKRLAIVHIGTEKTGTTTLQRALSLSCQALERGGFRYPLLGAGHAHAALTAFAFSGGNEADLPVLGGRHPDETRTMFDARIEEELALEVEAHPNATFIFSSEHASSRLVHTESILRLKELLIHHFDEIRICVYLRRWDRMAVSAYSTFVQSGLTTLSPFDHFRDTTYLDYKGILDRWAAVFGPERLDVAIFERNSLIGGSVVSDFAARFSLPRLETMDDRNVSFAFKDLRTLALINRLLVNCSRTKAAAIRALAVATFKEKGGSVPIPPEQAQSFNAHYAQQSEYIRDKYFPERSTLFDDDYSNYGLPVGNKGSNWKAASEKLIDALQIALP